jgi:3-hydroxyacyl-CoA dehydrogenase/3a,7a,12a-trihydroxy-5b-cholest-24-enoyl-CoA hydratase
MVSLETVHAAIGQTMPAILYDFDERDTILYALGVGAPLNPFDKTDLKYVYELHPAFCALPTMPVIYSSKMIDDIVSGNIAGIEFNPMMLVHGEQAIELHKQPPAGGKIRCVPQIRNIYDKGSGMLIVTDVTCFNEQDDTIAVTTSSMFIRGLGDFGGERGSSDKITIPEREPDVTHEEATLDRQALLYRLSGDINPLHADPDMAAVGNFKRPILHGLSTYGFAARTVLRHFADNDPARFKSMSARFSAEVYPGETLVTDMWDTDDGVVFQTRAKERDAIVLNNARVIVT